VFPRWCGYANGWMALTIIPDQLLFFFHRGPFAWNGIFGVWVPVVVFSGFFIAISSSCVKRFTVSAGRSRRPPQQKP